MFSDCKYVIFDLDGTITDPKVGITTCAKFALTEMGYESQAKQDLSWMIGPPLLDTFMKITGCDQVEGQRLIDKYRERYSILGVHENTLYQGIENLLKHLKSAGKTLAIASSKPTFYVEQILDDFNIKEYFEVVQGSDMAGKHVEKEDVLKIALTKLGIVQNENLQQAVMIGDRKFDILAAKSFGMKSIAVTYGYAVKGEWDNLKADAFVSSPTELISLFN